VFFESAGDEAIYNVE